MGQKAQRKQRLADRLRAARPIVFYGAILAAGTFLLSWLDYQPLARSFAGEIQIFLVAALFMALCISAFAGILYVLAWEATLALTGRDFGAFYTEHLIEAAKVRGASKAELAALLEKAEEFAKMYANPLFQMPITFTEILPVGLLVSLVAALLLRNSRFMPARA